MFAVGEELEVRFDISTGTVWRRGTIIDVEFDSNHALNYVVRVVWHVTGHTVTAEFVFTVDDIANGMFRRI